MFLSRLKESRYTTLILASIFAFTLFLQCCFFHYQAFHSILISSLWNDPISFFTFYAPKISISLFIASFVFLFKRKSWTIYVSFIVSVWCIAELVYYRIYDAFLDPYTILLANNMNGFWDSVIPLLYLSDYIFIILNFIYIISYIYFKNKNTNTNKVLYIIICIISIIIQIIAGNLLYQKTSKYYTIKYESQLFINFYNPYCYNFLNIIYGGGHTTIQYHDDYPKDLSVIHHLILNIVELLTINDNSKNLNENINISPEIAKLINYNKTDSEKKYNRLLIILVESLENWVISEEITPNLNLFINKNKNILYARKITKQTLKSASADGQMIINTGILPTREGHVCYDYFQNTFPALSKLYAKSSALIPGHLGMWNQRSMSNAYSIKSSYSIIPNDRFIIENTIKKYSEFDYLLSLTISSHLPFKAFSDSSLINISYKPKEVSDYLKSINFFDSHLGSFIDLINTDSILQNTTIVITSDHTILTAKMRKEFSDYCKENNLDYKVEENYCPLIIYSPNIKEKTIVDEVAYQMDIYPTILHVIGAEDYYWKGFGVNLLDSLARRNRSISPEDAFELSDKLIRANYFKEIEDSLYSTIK